MKKLLMMLFLTVTLHNVNAQVLVVEINTSTNVLYVNGSVYTGSKDSLLGLYKFVFLPQDNDPGVVDLAAIKRSTRRRHRGLAKQKKLLVTTFQKQEESWVAIVTQEKELSSNTPK